MSKFRQGLIALILVLLGCASTGGADGENGNRDVLTRPELTEFDARNALETLQQVRPRWLRANRGQSSLHPSAASRRGIRVYLDSSLLGGVQELRSVSVRDLEEIRFLDGRQATLRFGTDHGEGAIVLTSR